MSSIRSAWIAGTHGDATLCLWPMDAGWRARHPDGRECDVPLRPKSFEVLHYLIQNAGQLVSREDVLGAVWPDVIVTEESLTQCVSEVRQALGGAGQTIIRTIPKRGYLFDMPVRIEETHDSKGPANGLVTARRAMLEGASIACCPSSI